MKCDFALPVVSPGVPCRIAPVAWSRRIEDYLNSLAAGAKALAAFLLGQNYRGRHVGLPSNPEQGRGRTARDLVC